VTLFTPKYERKNLRKGSGPNALAREKLRAGEGKLTSPQSKPLRDSAAFGRKIGHRASPRVEGP
jgi:hypothetical protein